MVCSNHPLKDSRSTEHKASYKYSCEFATNSPTNDDCDNKLQTSIDYIYPCVIAAAGNE